MRSSSKTISCAELRLPTYRSSDIDAVGRFTSLDVAQP